MAHAAHLAQNMGFPQLRLLSDDPERMAMQLAAGARRAALPAAGYERLLLSVYYLIKDCFSQCQCIDMAQAG